ncbi:MAG: PD40 domain-containing protein [Candidatus Aminicenantes bacterium]|nr:PD40 domain-containing protein [Candidatus Aminicenantes bacterium]
MKKREVFAGPAVLAVVLVVGVLAAGHPLPAPFQQSAEELYQTALLKKEAEGDLSGAIKLFQDIIAKFPDTRDVAAKAQLQIGVCYEKMGTAEAEKAFQKVIDNYPEQSEAVREAKGKLSLLLRARALVKTGDSELRLRQVWAGPLVDIMGAVSPDGRYLSFVDWITGDLAIRDLASGKNRRLTNKGSWQQSPEFAMFSKWAPDSRRIAYQWYNENETFELRVIDIEDPKPHILYQPSKKSEYVQPFDWTPDGTSILAGLYSGNDQTFLADEMKGGLGLISVEEGSVRILKTQIGGHSGIPREWGFAFSPDGKYIAYDSSQGEKDSGKHDVFLFSVDGSTEIPLIEHPANDTVLDWTPGGEGLLFLSDRTGTQDAWFLRFAGGKPQGNPLFVRSGVGGMAGIFPMGITSQCALFYGIQVGGTDIYEVGIDPETGKIVSPAKKTVLIQEGHNAYPDYSPDGKLLAYIFNPRMPIVDPEQTLRMISLEEGQIRELRPDWRNFGYPQWAPDGRAISVEGEDKDDRKGIYRVDVETGGVVPIVLIDEALEVYSHRWSKDGKLMYYSTGEEAGKTGSIFVHDFETGRDERLSGSPSDANWFDISPDGKWLVLINRAEKRIIKIMPTSGGEPRDIYSFTDARNRPINPAWSADGRYVYFSKLRLPEALWDLYRVSADGGEPQRIDLTMAQIRHLSAHPDGQRIAFSSQGTSPQESQVWVMENFLPKSAGDK